MGKIIAIFTFAFQISLTFIATFSIYMVFALLDSDFGLDGLFGLIIVQPIMAIILSGLTIFFCLIIGLPIRLNKKINHWWTTNFFVPIIGATLGLIFLILALLPAFSETVTYELDGEPTLKETPNSFFSIAGWLLTAFSLLHVYPPKQLIKRLQNMFTSKLKSGI